MTKQNSKKINNEITTPVVHVQIFRGSDLGVMPIAKALEEARKLDLDLVLRPYNADPPICEIRDISPYIYNDEIDRYIRKVPLPETVEINSAEVSLTSEDKGFKLDIPAHEIKTHFGDDRQILTKISSGIRIPYRAQKFLQTIGLPTRVFGNYFLDYGECGLIRLDEYLHWYQQVEKQAFEITNQRIGREIDIERRYLSPLSIDTAKYFRLGEMSKMHALVIDSDSDAISIVDFCGKSGKHSLVNSSIEQFAQFLVLVDKAYDDVNSDSTNCNIQERLKQLYEDLKMLDPSVMDERNTRIWLTTIFEMEHGLI